MTNQDFCASYERELLGRAERRQSVELLAELSLRIPISIGCYCEDDSICHRKHLQKLIERAARKLVLPKSFVFLSFPPIADWLFRPPDYRHFVLASSLQQ